MKNNKLLIIIIIVLAFVLIGVGVTFAFTSKGKDNSTNPKDEKVNRMNEEHIKDGVKVTSFSITKDDSNPDITNNYKVSVNIVNDTGKEIVTGKIDCKLISETGEKRDYTAFMSNLKAGDSTEYSKNTTFDISDFYDYEMEVTVSDVLAPMGY